MKPSSLYLDMERPDQKSLDPCYHCGDVCINAQHREDGNIFCCGGCKLVYGILKDGGLEHFYSDGPAPGNRVKDLDRELYSYLDEEVIREKLILFDDGEQAKVRLHLPSIHCSSCLWLLENLNKLEPGILGVKVDFAKRKALITYSTEQISLRELAELLHSIGYPPHISLASETDGHESVANKALITKIGVTGFLFGNIMLLSFPEYLSTGIDLIEEYRWFFSGLILLLSLPVLFYGAKDYFTSSLASLRMGKLVIDVPIAIGIAALFFAQPMTLLLQQGWVISTVCRA